MYSCIIHHCSFSVHAPTVYLCSLSLAKSRCKQLICDKFRVKYNLGIVHKYIYTSRRETPNGLLSCVIIYLQFIPVKTRTKFILSICIFDIAIQLYFDEKTNISMLLLFLKLLITD